MRFGYLDVRLNMTIKALLLLAFWQGATAFRTPAPLLQRGKHRAPLKTLRAAAAEDTGKAPSLASGIAKLPPLVPRVAGFATLAIADEACRVAFKGTSLPHSLAGGGVLVALLIATGGVGEKLHSKVLAPGSALLLSWMPVFFAPALVLLPLAEPVVATARDAAALAVVVVGGLAASLSATALAVGAVRANASNAAAPAPSSAKGVVVPFGTPLLTPLAFVTALSGVLVAQGKNSFMRPYFVAATLGSFVFGSRFVASLAKSQSAAKKALARALHPVAQCALVTSIACRVLAQATSKTTTATLKSYGSLAGAPLQRLLGASVLALACGVYGRRREVRENWKAVLAGTLTGVGVGLYGTALAARAVGLPRAARLALLPRCITSPLAVAVCTALSTPPAAAVALVVVTGVLGAALGPAALDAMGKKDPVARGMAMGAAAHGIGTAQLDDEPEAQPFAAIAMSLVGAASVVAAAAPASRALLLRAAGV